MSDCCDHSPGGKRRCPDCGNVSGTVSLQTLLHHIRSPLNQHLGEQARFFCGTPDCATVYFSAAGERYRLKDLRTPVGQKSHDPDRTLCYCFGISHKQVMDEEASAGCGFSRTFVEQQTRLKNCACEVRNPSGRCCLRDFPEKPPA